MENINDNNNNNQNDSGIISQKMSENINEENNNNIKENNESKEKQIHEIKIENNIENNKENNNENNNENNIEKNIEKNIENNKEKNNENNNENNKENYNENNKKINIENNNKKSDKTENINDSEKEIENETNSKNINNENKNINKEIDNNKEIEKINEINNEENKNIQTKENDKKIKDDILSGSKIKKTDEEIEQIENKKIFDNIKNFSKISTSLKLKLLSLLNIHSLISKTLNITIPKEYLNFLSKNEQKKFEIYSKINEIISLSNDNNKNLLENYLDELDYEKYNISKETNNEIKPIHDFWRFAIKNSNFFEMNEKDEEIFYYIKTIEGKIENDSKIFKLIINFQENNKFCENNSITKTYYYNDKLNKIIKVDYEEIKWKSDDLNPTLKKKKFKNKKGNIKIKYVDNPSFFDIFDEKKSNLENDEGECEFLKDSFFPNLLEYYMNFHDDSEDSDY